ncbi:hypothetical protein FE782_20255 [Paenibacillus antri]|uniref:DUF4190 domain-containing protein n=1 Tax=Paenibacillus antri TaxID=2582848 RepID=A0A5R9G1Z3_9BACL|nr:hypothetical protein [Paenibacillus antri]TLS50362.1 hypothetical protein FE782_20255 [Paenibacillus antri]
MNESMEDRSVSDDASSSFGPETEFESESSVSDKAFFQEEAVHPVAEKQAVETSEPKGTTVSLFGPEERDTEFGSDLAVPAGAASNGAAAKPFDAGKTIGWVGIFLAIASFFVLGSILGPAAIVVGFMAFAKGRKKLGIWSMGLGIISFVIFLALLPNNAV